MKSENPKTVNATQQQANQFHFTAKIVSKKLTINAQNLNDKNTEYFAQIEPNQFIDFERILEQLAQKQPTISQITQERLKIKIGASRFELFNKKTIDPIKSIKWSPQLKHNSFKIDGNVIKLEKDQDQYGTFCLLDAPFLYNLNTKQSWTLKINKLKSVAFLGICLKNYMKDYSFSLQKVCYKKLGQGLYFVANTGFCNSHSSQEFNFVTKQFTYGTGDVITIEYDPVDLKLRFIKNKSEQFEMPIIKPPENDSYYPFVGLLFQNQEVQLIQS